jgi:DNA repair ATPase RecN
MLRAMRYCLRSQRHFEAWQEAKAKLESAREALENAARDREWLEHAVAELRKFAPEEGEEEQLATERADMQKGERIAEDLRAVLERLKDRTAVSPNCAARHESLIGWQRTCLAR